MNRRSESSNIDRAFFKTIALNMLLARRTLNHQFHIRRGYNGVTKCRGSRPRECRNSRKQKPRRLLNCFPARSARTRARIQARREVYDFTLLPRRCIVKMYYGRACIERGLISCLHLIVPVLEQRLRVVLLTATPPRAAGGFTSPFADISGPYLRY